MDLTIRKGGRGDLEGYLSFLHDVKQGMDHDEWFFLDPDEEVRAMMAEGFFEFWLAEDGARIAGVFCLIHPGSRSFNLGWDLGLEEKELLRVVHMDTAAVHPDYRGRKLQNRLMAEAEQALVRQGRRILLCTVHPQNQYSMQNVLKQGYSVQKKLEKYGSVRYILRKDLP